MTKQIEDYIKENLTEKEMKDYYENKIVGDIEAKHILIAVKNDDNATDEEKEANDKKAKEKAKEIIEKDNGSIRVSSDNGTKFSIRYYK